MLDGQHTTYNTKISGFNAQSTAQLKVLQNVMKSRPPKNENNKALCSRRHQSCLQGGLILIKQGCVTPGLKATFCSSHSFRRVHSKEKQKLISTEFILSD